MLGTPLTDNLLIVSQFLEDYEPTKVDSYRKRIMVEGDQVMLDIVDTAGQEDYAAVRDHYLRTADGYLCVFSLSEPESLQDIIDLRQVCLFLPLDFLLLDVAHFCR